MASSSFADIHPELICEWSNKNTFSPKDISYGSNKKVWWKAKCGHEWKASIKSRHNGAGCPICSGNLIVKGINDLSSFSEQLSYEWSDKNLPLKPTEVGAHSPKTVWWKCKHDHEWQARIADRVNGSGCPYCTGQKIYKGFNDLEYLYPNIAKEWSNKNLPLKPDSVFPKSRKNVWWKCSVCGYEWRAVINTRVKGSACPICAQRDVAIGINDLFTTNSELKAEWNYIKNDSLARPIYPETQSKHSLYKVWWKGKCGHEWKARIVDRAVNGEGCPECRKEYLSILPYLLFSYYCAKYGFSAKLNDDSIIGIPFDIYIPALSSAIDFVKPVNDVKGYLCHKNGIKLYYLPIQSDEYTMAEKVRQFFKMNNIFISTDIETDLEIVKRKYNIIKSSRKD